MQGAGGPAVRKIGSSAGHPPCCAACTPCAAPPTRPRSAHPHCTCPPPPAEGDAFHVAFKDVQAAVLFCMEVQYQVGCGVRCGGCRVQGAED